jgi:hypothetical protein
MQPPYLRPPKPSCLTTMPLPRFDFFACIADNGLIGEDERTSTRSNGVSSVVGKSGKGSR